MPSPVALSPSTPLTNARRERLAGPLLTRDGQIVEPGDAFPFPPAHRVPTMLSDRELNYLYWLASTLPAPSQVVELGSFLGGSTAALVEGLRVSGRTHHPVLVYDSFLAPSNPEVINSWWMRPFGLSPGQNFRARYEKLHASRLDRLKLREGWIPENADTARQRSLYPEQRSIDLLFVDAAKTWSVHRTILTAFARHLRPGAVLVQQDFLDVQTPWLPAHMWQLRSVFRPLDHIHASPSMAFECVSDPNQIVDAAWDESEFVDRDRREDLWQRVLEYWSGLIGSAAGFLHGHAARHAAMMADYQSMVSAARRYEGWLASRDSDGVYATPTWSELLHTSAAQAETKGQPRCAAAIRVLAGECDVRRVLPAYARATNTTFYSPNIRMAHWQSLMNRLMAQGHDRIALYGGGAHTEWLLDHWPHTGIRVECILDDAPTRSEIAGLAVRKASVDAVPAGLPIAPSSDAHEAAIVRRAESVFAGRNPIHRVYTSPEQPLVVTPRTPQSLRETAPPMSLQTKHLQAEAPHRADLGLHSRRVWLDSFAEKVRVPAWARGFVNDRDAQFLWDLVEAVRPDVVVEIGTASGISTAMLAAACDHFGGTASARGVVHTFDIAQQCYFDQTRPVGDAINEAFGHLRDAVVLHPGRTAIDAARCFSPGSVDLAFIDGDHRHPTPTLDLLALLYTLKPGAWVVLHDIELTEVARVSREAGKLDWELATGAESLFKRWPFAKTQPRHPHASMNNIGAMKLPMNVGDAAEFLLGLLSERWELTGEPSLEALRETLAAGRAQRAA